MAARESRPAANEAAGSLTDRHKRTSKFSVHARLRVDLRGLGEDEVRGRVRHLSFAPAGAHVILTVDRGQYPPSDAVAHLVEQNRLGVVCIESDDSRAIESWMQLFRGEDPFHVL